jgi:EAL domain-containing protein (putative c-di-GMP-specific phosphodiesterase class I)
VVAEGIETPEQHAILLGMQCEFGQGFLFSRPMPKPDVDALVGRMVSFAPSERGRPYSLTTNLPN